MAEAISLYGYRLRPQQERVLAYRGGRMAVSAVPGSGKTLTLALLAARMIVEGRLSEESDVLVVTVQTQRWPTSPSRSVVSFTANVCRRWGTTFVLYINLQMTSCANGTIWQG